MRISEVLKLTLSDINAGDCSSKNQRVVGSSNSFLSPGGSLTDSKTISGIRELGLIKRSSQSPILLPGLL